MANERRQSKRFEVQPLLCYLGEGEKDLCILRQVSLRGMFLNTDHPPLVGETVDILFFEEPLNGYQLKGTVARRTVGQNPGFALSLPGPRPRLLKAYHSPPFASLTTDDAVTAVDVDPELW